MAVKPENVDLTGVEDVTDIEPEPTIAVSDTEQHIGSIGDEGEQLLRELLEDTDEEEPFDERVFETLDEEFAHLEWNDYDLYWADDEDDFVDALEDWGRDRAI